MQVRGYIADRLTEELEAHIRVVRPPLIPHAKKTAKAKRKAKKEVADGDANVHVAMPAQALQLAFKACPDFANLVWRICFPDGQNQLCGTQDRPLRVIMYSDEVAPGNSLDPANNRKFHACYWSVLELGRWVLTQVWAWQLLAMVRSDTVKLIEGGLSYLTALLLREFFVVGRLGTHGFLFDFEHSRVQVYFAYHGLLADEDAIHMSLNVKGASGHRVCVKHRNIVQKRSGLSGDGYHIDHDCADASLFQPETDEGVFRAADALAAACNTEGVRQGQQDRLETAFGLTYSRFGPLFDVELRPHFKPITGLRWDACHVWYANGVVQVELASFMEAAWWKVTKPPTWEHLESICSANWRYPGEAHLQKSRTLAASMFRGKKISEAGFPRISASESLLAVHLVRYFVENVVRRMEGAVNHLQLEMRSVSAMCSAALTLQAVKRGVRRSADLQEATATYMRRRNEAYPETIARPKHHFAMDLPDQIRADGELVLDCFVHERKHQDGKDAGGKVFDPGEFGKSVLKVSLWNHLNYMKEHAPEMCTGRESYLEEPAGISKELTALLGRGTRSSRTALLRHGKVSAGDVAVLGDESVVVVQAPIHRDGDTDVCIVGLRTQRRRDITRSAALYDVLENAVIVPQHSVQHLCVWAEQEGGLLVLWPL